MQKSFKKHKEEILRNLILKSKVENWVTNVFYARKLKYNKWMFCEFVNWRRWLSKQRLEFLEWMFKIKIKE